MVGSCLRGLVMWGCVCISLTGIMLANDICWAMNNQPVSRGFSYGSGRVQSDQLDMSPSNPLAPPGTSTRQNAGSESVNLSNSLLQGILPHIPNLQLGYFYSWDRQPQGRLILDYTCPVKWGRDVVFAEIHSRFQDLVKTIGGDPNPDAQVLFGGGYRHRMTREIMVGANGFYNTTRLSGQWRSSGIAGLELCFLTPGNGMVDASFNYYGNVFSADTGVFAVFSQGQGDYKLEAAYSQPMFQNAFTLRLKGSHYEFHKLGNVRGYYVGSDFRSSDGMYRLEYTVGQDAISGKYQNLAFYFTVGFRVENIFSGNSPFTKP